MVMNPTKSMNCPSLPKPDWHWLIPLPLLEAALLLTWSSGFVGARFSIDYAPALLVVFWRCVVVTLVLLPFVARALRRTSPVVLLKNAGIGLLAMAAPGGPGQSPSIVSSLIPFALMFVIFYFLLIAPQRKKAKAHTAMLDALKAGDKVVTNGGIFGTVVGVDDQKVQLRVADQVKIDVAKHAIAGMQQQE